MERQANKLPGPFIGFEKTASGINKKNTARGNDKKKHNAAHRLKFGLKSSNNNLALSEST